jgi:hypothetical protein
VSFITDYAHPIITDPVWAYHVHRSPDLRDEEVCIRDLIDETPTSEVGYALASADFGSRDAVVVPRTSCE